MLIGSDARDFMEVIEELDEIDEAKVAEKPGYDPQKTSTGKHELDFTSSSGTTPTQV